MRASPLPTAQLLEVAVHRHHHRDRPARILGGQLRLLLPEQRVEIDLRPRRIAGVRDRRDRQSRLQIRFGGQRSRHREHGALLEILGDRMIAVVLHDRIQPERGTLEQPHHLVHHDVVADLDSPLARQLHHRVFVDRIVGTLRPEHRDHAPAMLQVVVQGVDLMLSERLDRSRDDDQVGVVRNLRAVARARACEPRSPRLPNLF